MYINIYRKCLKVKPNKLEELKIWLSMHLSNFSLRGSAERKIILALVLALILTPVLTFHIGSNKNLSRSLIEERLNADEELDQKLTEKHEILYPSAKSETKVALSDNSTVYVTKTGKKYHRDGCSSLSKSKIAITYAEAVAKGYTPCKSCN